MGDTDVELPEATPVVSAWRKVGRDGVYFSARRRPSCPIGAVKIDPELNRPLGRRSAGNYYLTHKCSFIDKYSSVN